MAHRPFYRFNNIGFQVGTTQLAALPDNPNRVYLLIQNNGALNLYASFGAPTAGVQIAPAGSYEWSPICPNSSLYLYTQSGSVNVIVVEGVLRDL